jgi:hypothetical protein
MQVVVVEDEHVLSTQVVDGAVMHGLERSSSARQIAAELESRFARFDAERKSAREQLQTRYVRLGLGVCVLGAVVAVAGIVTGWRRRLSASVGVALLMAGVLTTTMADHDLDEVFSRRSCPSIPGPVVGVVCMVVFCINDSPVFAIAALPSLYFFVRLRPVLDRVPSFLSYTQIMVASAVGFLLGMAGLFIQWALQPDFDKFPVAAAWALGAYYLLSAAAVIALHRRWAPRMAPSPCMWRCVYTFFALLGVGNTARGVASSTATYIYLGLAQVPAAAAFLLFRDVISGYLEQHFYRGRRLQDGGFIAELAQPSIMRVGARHDWHDPASCSWHEARVTVVHRMTFDVRLVADNSTKKNIPSPGTNMTAGQLRQMALGMLRCVPGDKITLELLRSSEGSAATFALGQECVPGDIDFFLSHSWHDDPVAKFKEIEKVRLILLQGHGSVRERKC